jgi:hypothetical protein
VGFPALPLTGLRPAGGLSSHWRCSTLFSISFFQLLFSPLPQCRCVGTGRSGEPCLSPTGPQSPSCGLPLSCAGGLHLSLDIKCLSQGAFAVPKATVVSRAEVKMYLREVLGGA